MIKKIILLIFISFISSFNIFAYQVDLPNWGSNIKSTNTINTDTEFYINTSKKVTNYLWYILWAISFGIVLYAWTLLLKWEWEDQELKKANKMLVWWLIWIFTSLLAYSIVNLIINLW